MINVVNHDPTPDTALEQLRSTVFRDEKAVPPGIRGSRTPNDPDGTSTVVLRKIV